MSNVLTDYMDTLIMPMALSVLRESCVMPALVSQDFKNEAASKNTTIRIKSPQNMGTAGNFDPAVGSSSTDFDDPYVDITLAEWKYKQFEMSDKEVLENVLEKGALPGAMDSAIKSIANAVDTSIINLYTGITNYYGAPTTTPSASADIIGVRKVLETNLCPPDNRRLVFDVNAEAAMLDLYEKANEFGSTEALRNASLGRLFGFETYKDQLITGHTKGTLAANANIAAKAIYSIGTTSIILDDSGGGSLTGTLLKGDKFTFAGDTTVYHVTANATAAANEIAIVISPGLVKATADGTVVTLKTGWIPNLAFHRDAIALAMRPIADAEMGSESSLISTMVDPVSGLPMRLETWRAPKYATRYWRFDVLYGVKIIRPELIAILFG